MGFISYQEDDAERGDRGGKIMLGYPLWKPAPLQDIPDTPPMSLEEAAMIRNKEEEKKRRRQEQLKVLEQERWKSVKARVLKELDREERLLQELRDKLAKKREAQNFLQELLDKLVQKQPDTLLFQRIQEKAKEKQKEIIILQQEIERKQQKMAEKRQKIEKVV